MEKKNPLENIRKAIIGGRFSGIENEVTRLGVSDELMKISDALDIFYGIEREKKEVPSNEGGHGSLIGVMNEYYKTHPNSYTASLSRTSYSRYLETSFGGELSLLSKVKAPLLNMKQKLSKDNSLYLDISTTIASIAFNSVVSRINSYKKAPRSPFESNYSYSSLTGIDDDYCQLIINGVKVFGELDSFDMAPEFHDNYLANRKVIFSLLDKIDELMHKPLTSASSKSSSSGCMVVAIALSTSMISFFGFILSLVL